MELTKFQILFIDSRFKVSREIKWWYEGRVVQIYKVEREYQFSKSTLEFQLSTLFIHSLTENM